MTNHGEKLSDKRGGCPERGQAGCTGDRDPAGLIEDDHEEEPAGDDLCDLCMSSGVNADRTTPCGKTIGVECGCDESHADGFCGDKSCVDCYGDGDEEDEDDDLAMAHELLERASPGLPTPATLDEALDALEAVVMTLPHASRCPARHPAGECLCIRSEVLTFLHDNDREV